MKSISAIVYTSNTGYTQRYAAMLESDWKNLTENALFDTYNSAAEEFNHKLTDTPVGKLAGLLGVTPCELYE